MAIRTCSEVRSGDARNEDQERSGRCVEFTTPHQDPSGFGQFSPLPVEVRIRPQNGGGGGVPTIRVFFTFFTFFQCFTFFVKIVLYPLYFLQFPETSFFSLFSTFPGRPTQPLKTSNSDPNSGGQPQRRICFLCGPPHDLHGLKKHDASPIFRRHFFQFRTSFWSTFRPCFGGKIRPCVERIYDRVWRRKNKGVLRRCQTRFKHLFLTGFLAPFLLLPPQGGSPLQNIVKMGFGLERSV